MSCVFADLEGSRGAAAGGGAGVGAGTGGGDVRPPPGLSVGMLDVGSGGGAPLFCCW